jgi:hypothetical protein
VIRKHIIYRSVAHAVSPPNLSKHDHPIPVIC